MLELLEIMLLCRKPSGDMFLVVAMDELRVCGVIVGVVRYDENAAKEFLLGITSNCRLGVETTLLLDRGRGFSEYLSQTAMLTRAPWVESGDTEVSA